MFFSKLALASAVVSVVNGLSISTPASLIVCQPVSLTFTDGTSPYYLAVLPGGEASATAVRSLLTSALFGFLTSAHLAYSIQLEQFPSITSSPYTWNVDLPADTNVTIRITDGTGTIAYTSTVVIQAGSSTSCLNSTSSSSSASSSASSTAAVAGASSSGTASGAVASAKSATSAAAAATSSVAAKSAGFASVNQVGVAGLLGVVAAAMGLMA
ncbi:hypothetical protein P7C73_g366, partial [Tremellales sp. Uapishka_1]